MTGFDLAVASLRIWAVEVDVEGRTFRIPPQPAAEWFLAVLSGDAWPIVPGMLGPGDEEDFLDHVLTQGVSEAAVTRANRDALATAAGWPWWQAERIVVSAASEWKVVGGILQGAGVDVERLSLGAVLSSIYAMCVTHMTKEDRFKFDAQLTAPPIGYVADNPEEWFASTGAAESFADLLRTAQGGGLQTGG